MSDDKTSDAVRGSETITVQTEEGEASRVSVCGFLISSIRSSVVSSRSCPFSMAISLFFARRLATVSASASHSSPPFPLSCVTVVDLTRILAGPFCSMLLGDLGARVIKIEHPDGGDETRRWGPPFLGGKESCYFLSVNRNKESMALNLRSTDGQNILRKLIAKSDVVIENFVPGKLDEYGLGYEDLRVMNEGLIYCSVTGFGSDGPYARRAGYDIMAASIGGLLNVTGPLNGEPCKVGVAMTDLATGLYAHGAIMAALLQRQSTGRGQWVQANLLATQVSCMVNLAANYLNAGLEPERRGTAHESIVPYQSFKCADGTYLSVGALSDAQFQKFCRVVGAPQLASDDRFKANAGRVAAREELVSVLDSIFESQPVDEWISRFDGSGLPYGPVNTLERVFADPQVQHLRMDRVVEHPTAGGVHVCGPAVAYSASSCDVRSAPPLLGQHTRRIMASLGYSEDDIDRFISLGAIYEAAPC